MYPNRNYSLLWICENQTSYVLAKYNSQIKSIWQTFPFQKRRIRKEGMVNPKETQNWTG
jgi:hypothetical protein